MHGLIVRWRRSTKLWKALGAAYGRTYAFAALLKVAQDALSFLQPQLLRVLLQFIAEYQRAKAAGDTPPSPLQGFAITALMVRALPWQVWAVELTHVCAQFAASLCQTVILHQYFQRCFVTGMRVRAGLIAVIYDKALALSSAERSRSSGDIVNLMVCYRLGMNFDNRAKFF
jgi:ATP-binding cassette subfamily C (CFTR/MRP) protein 1